jgi:hypothetical protein
MVSLDSEVAMTDGWRTALTLASDRSVASGSVADLAAAVGRGADLRIYTEFRYEEHIAPGGDGDASHDGLVREVIDFRETILLDGAGGPHVAAVTTLRQPLHPPWGFNGTEPKMSYFLYQSDGRQACANLLLGDVPSAVRPGARAEIPTPADMPRMSAEVVWDIGTAGPSRNFIYEMEVYRYIVRDEWQELLAVDASGAVLRGSVDAIEAAQIAGREFKVGIRGLCAELGHPDEGPEHEVFTLVGSGFFHTGMRVYDTLTHPLVRVAPAIPLEYRSGGWDVAWVHVRTDGAAVVRRLDPYSRQFSDHAARFALRFFAR